MWCLRGMGTGFEETSGRLMVSEATEDAQRHCCCCLCRWARKVICRDRREVVRRWSSAAFDISALLLDGKPETRFRLFDDRKASSSRVI